MFSEYDQACAVPRQGQQDMDRAAGAAPLPRRRPVAGLSPRFLVLPSPAESVLEAIATSRPPRRSRSTAGPDRQGPLASVPRRRRRPYSRTFDAVLDRIEAVLAGEQPADDAATTVSLIDRLQAVSRSVAPPSVRAASTLPELHAALLEWQDVLEVRDGVRPGRRLVRTVVDTRTLRAGGPAPAPPPPVDRVGR